MKRNKLIASILALLGIAAAWAIVVPLPRDGDHFAFLTGD